LKRIQIMEMLRRATEAVAKLQMLIETSADLGEISQLDLLRQNLINLNSVAANVAKSSKTLAENNVPLSPQSTLADIKDATDKLAAKFNETPKSTSVFEGKKWVNFLEKTTLAIKNATESVDSDWAKFFTSLFGGMPPEQRRLTVITKIPENKVAIDIYSNLYNELKRYKSTVPEDKEDFITIKNLVKKISEIKFKENIPENVKKFFDQTTFGASLEYLTEDVMVWLRENDLLSSFVVRAKG
jgi:hypothetical protein